ncbi:hypothetical protein PSTG_18276, partial [Puccinia striiformis f. sp. tritici PST-78]
MRGVVYLTNNEEMLKKLQNIIINVIEKYKTNNAFSLSEVKTKMKNDLQDYIKKETVPIFTSKLTDFMIKQKLERFRFINQNEIIIKTIEPEQKVSFGNVVVKKFKTTTSIPGSLGFVLT